MIRPNSSLKTRREPSAQYNLDIAPHTHWLWKACRNLLTKTVQGLTGDYVKTDESCTSCAFADPQTQEETGFT
jgi:hypothetical protein